MTEESGSRHPPPPGARASRPLPGTGLLVDTAAMLRFYSRLPLPSLGVFDDPADPPPFQRAARMLPVASFMIALTPALTLLMLGVTHLPHVFTATAATALGLAVTGVLHEDGLADMVDGFGGGGTIARKLEIMKDSRIGSYGASALVLALVARIVLTAALMDRSVLIAAASLVAGAILSRSMSLAVFAWLPAARAEGVSVAVGRPDRQALAFAIVLTIALIAVLAAPWSAVEGISLTLRRFVVSALCAGLVAYWLGRLARSQVGGQTGDVLGAVQVLSEIAFLAGLLVIGP